MDIIGKKKAIIQAPGLSQQVLKRKPVVLDLTDKRKYLCVVCDYPKESFDAKSLIRYKVCKKHENLIKTRGSWQDDTKYRVSLSYSIL